MKNISASTPQERSKRILWENIIVFFLILVFIASMIWINFHNHLWFQSDSYTYAYEGKLMWESLSCFPHDWVFANQFHIVSSPNLAALFYGFTKDCVRAMAFASSITIILVLLSFLWCCYPFLNNQSLWAGALCIIGGIIFGTNAATYISGLQVLYTMSSFYACYLIGLLLTLGVWLRLCTKRKISILLIIIILPLHFALGMQSPREMLILIIPLLLTHGFCTLQYRFKNTGFQASNKAFMFLIGILVAELAGHFYMGSLSIAATPIIGELQLDLHPSHLVTNVWLSTKNILRISGLAIASDSLKYLPLSVCALFIALAIVFTISLIIKKNDNGPLAILIIFSLFSILCVYGIGIFLMRTRDIYYFVYWLLATLCICYIINHANPLLKKIVILAIILICSVNYCFTFIPNYKDYHENHEKLEAFTQSLVNRGIQVIYTDDSPIFAAASHDRIVSQTYWLDYSLKSGFPLTVFPSDKHTIIYDDAHYEKSLICISDYYCNAILQGPDVFKKELLDNLEPVDQITFQGNTFILYQSKKRIISPFFASFE